MENILNSKKGQSAANIKENNVMGKHLSKEEFIKVVREKYHEPFEILEYNGTSKRGRYKCGLCKKEFSIYRMGVLIKDEREHFCPKCW